MVDQLRASPYQQPLNSTGFLTSNSIGHVLRFEPCQNFHNTRTTIYDGKPLPLVMRNPLPLNDSFVTTNNLYHQQKYHEDTYLQPKHKLAPGLNKIDFIMPEFHKRVSRASNLGTIHDTSETRSQFHPHRREFDMYGPPLIHINTRDLYSRAYNDYIYQFNVNENSVLKRTHPYMTTNLIYHREFTPQELDNHSFLNAIDESNKATDTDVAIKYRVRPMHDPFEQKFNALGITPNVDSLKETCTYRPKDNLKLTFRRQLYTGCAPRTFHALENLGNVTSYTDQYSTPWRKYDKENISHGHKFCFIQPKGVSHSGANKVPNMYSTEAGVYGNGRCVDAFVRVQKVKDIVNPKGY